MDGYGEMFQVSVHQWLFSQDVDFPPETIKFSLLAKVTFNNDAHVFVEPPTAANYARVSVNDLDIWSNPTAVGDFITKTVNNEPITYIESTDDWGEIVAFAIVSSSSTTLPTNIWFGGDLTTPKTIDTATVAVFSQYNISLITKNQGL